MGWKGTVRSFVAASRAAERAAEKRGKQLAKERMKNEAEEAVAEWENYLNSLVSHHTSQIDRIDWHSIANTPMPQNPTHTDTNYLEAKEKLDRFKPRFFHIFLGGSKRIERKLLDKIERSIELDKNTFEKEKIEYPEKLKEWQEDTSHANNVLKGNAAALKEVIEDSLQQLSGDNLGISINCNINQSSVHAILQAHSDEIVPKFRRKQLASGKLSESKMPTGQFNELYQDYVASAAIKVAGSIFSILPLEECIVTCTTNMLNTSTGHNEISPILSILFTRNRFSTLQLNGIDPSNALLNFEHVMAFKKTKGFAVIEPLKPIT